MQVVPSSFHQKAAANVRRHKWGLLMSFSKEFDNERDFFMLDTSIISGGDLITPVGDSPIQFWDFYDYGDLGDRVVEMSWSRDVEFPYSTQSSTASVELNNYDGYFSSGGSSPVAEHLSPGRPTKLLAGYEGEPLLQQFVGLTQDNPEVDHVSRVARFEALDYLTEIFKLDLSETLSMSNVRTDQALAALFEQFGVESYQYDFPVGRNVIPFLFIEAGSSAADVIRDIMQAEGGRLWIDEQGIIKFDPRVTEDKTPVYTHDQSSISEMNDMPDADIVNRVKIKSNIRQIQRAQIIHSSASTEDNNTPKSTIIIPALGYASYNFDMSDPVGGYSVPTLGEKNNESWFTVTDETGGNINANVHVVEMIPTLENMSMTFVNTNGYPVTLKAVEVWGEPARIVDTINYEAFDQESIDAYGDHPLEIENDMFGSESNCESFAHTVIDAYSKPGHSIEARVKGNYATQVNDIIEVSTRAGAGLYQIFGMDSSISSSGSEQIIRARKYNPKPWFILDRSILNEEDILAP